MTSEERKEWLKSRQKGLGGSDIAGILGISPWATPLDVWDSKVNPLPEEEETTESMEIGTRIEDFIASEFALRMDMQVQRRNKTYVHKQFDFCIANIDRYVVGEKAGLECKNVSEWMSDGFGQEYTDEIPMYYLTQVMWYMEVTGYKIWHLAAFIGGNRVRIYTIEYNENIAKGLLDEAVKFWNSNVLAKVAPDPVNLEDIKKLYQKADMDSVEATEDIKSEIDLYVELKSSEKQLKEDIGNCKFRVQRFMMDHDTLVNETGDILLTWKKTKSGNRTFLPKKKKDN